MEEAPRPGDNGMPTARGLDRWLTLQPLSGLSRPQSPADIYVEALSPGSLDRK